MTDVKGALVLVTGAASGIGAAVATAVARDGARLILTDRNDLAQTTAGVAAQGGTVVLARRLDITDHEAVKELADEVHAVAGPVDIVLNVAGVSSWGTVSSLSHAQWRSMIDVNLMGPIHVIEAFLPAMIDAGRGGHLVNVSSAAGLIGMPWHAAYSASKFGLRGVSEVLRFDLRKHGIRVSLVCPGGVDTGLVRTIDIAGVDGDDPRFRRARAHFQKRAVSPERAADAILRGVRRNRYLVFTSPDIWAAYTLQRLFPPGYVAAMRVLNWGANKALPDVERVRTP